MKQLLLILTAFFVVNMQAQEEPRFESYNTGQAFTAITVDGINKKVWAGTYQSGVFNLDTEIVSPDVFVEFNGADPTIGPNLSDIRVTSMAADKLGNIWIGHVGINTQAAIGGVERISSNLNIKHYFSDTNFRGYPFHENSGLGTRRVRALAVDKNDKVWVAQKYTDLNVTADYYMNPGVFSYKASNSVKFTTEGKWYEDGNGLAVLPPELPYPRYTYNPGTNWAQNRSMYTIATDQNEMWVFMVGYIPDAEDGAVEEHIPARILRYNLNGEYISSGTALYGGFSFDDMGFPAGIGLINGICPNNEKGTWVTHNFSGRGFAVYKNGIWQHIDKDYIDNEGGQFSQIIPPATRFNNNAIWKDEIGRVFMGTDKGLIVYNGHGDPTFADSYRIYTNYDFGAASGNELNIHDSDMVSSDIRGGCSDPNSPHRSWVTTDTGIMKVFLPGELTMYHIIDYSEYDETLNNDEDIRHLINLTNEITDGDAEDDEIPTVAADRSHATMFRYYTDNPVSFYDGSMEYRIFVGDDLALVSEIDTDDYIKKYGKFTKKELSSYPENIFNSSYVEFIYTHPEYIDLDDYNEGEIYTDKYDINILDISDENENNQILFRHPIKISVPPVLILHGVWSNIDSVDPIREYLQNEQNFEDYTLSVQWRTIRGKDNFLPENSFGQDSPIIPMNIKKLKNNAADNMFSVGKINVVAHSRGGLYTRGYIEELYGVKYKKDVNSLITLDTPHWGAQGANLVLDKRVILSAETQINVFIVGLLVTGPEVIPSAFVGFEDITFGGIFNAFMVPKKDRTVNGGFDWGAKNLLVENDDVTGLQPYDGINFIPVLNRQGNLAKLESVPIHTISASVNPCIGSLCSLHFGENFDIDKADRSVVSRLLLITMLNFQPEFNTHYGIDITNPIGPILSWFSRKIYRGEPNDFVVPVSSQQAGLGGTDFNTHYPDDGNIEVEGNIDHSGSVGISVTKHPSVHAKIDELLRSNVYEDENGLFSQDGLGQHTPLTYDLFEDFLGRYAGRNTDSFVSKILINRDPLIFDNRIEGDVLNFNIYQEEVGRIMVTYETINGSENLGLEMRSENVVFQNSFSYTIPVGYSGKLKITAYGFNSEFLGIAKSVVTLNVGTPSDVTLQGIHFSVEEPVILNQNNYSYRVIGTYSDGIDRIINNADITFSIEDINITSQVDDSTIKGEQEGSTLFTATISGFEDTVLVKVVENQSLQQTIITNFYGISNTDNTAIAVNWETLHEYENATFVLETSYGTPDNFTEINQQAGNGTLNTPAQFNFDDDTFGTNTLIYYRIKMIDTSGNFVYSSTIEINLATTLGVSGEDLSSLNIELYPNPAKTNEVTLKLDSKFTDKNAKLTLYSLQGKRLSVQALNVQEGTNSFKLKIGEGLTNGIYLVRVTTTNYIKTVKLVIQK